MLQKKQLLLGDFFSLENERQTTIDEFEKEEDMRMWR